MVNVRRWAADEVIRSYLDMLILLSSSQSGKEDPTILAKLLISADSNRTGGLYKKVIWDSFRRRGLWPDFTPIGNVDVYIRDSDGDTGEHSSPEMHWGSPDIWVRNNSLDSDGENPDEGHQPPINDIPNYYIYVSTTEVHNQLVDSL